MLHLGQTPQFASVDTTTWSPGRTVFTSDPMASTMPAPSWPSTAGGFQGMVPLMTLTSEWHTPAATIFTTTSRAPGSGDASSSSSVYSALSLPR